MKVLWIPMFSMRSYETGEYAITKDGNFQLTLSRVLASDFDAITIVLPYQLSDYEEFQERLAESGIMDNMDVEFTFLEYGENAVDTRKTFWQRNQEFFYCETMLDYDLLITDITGYSGTMSYDIPFINNFNITKLPELDRPYIDQFFETDLANMRAALFTTVINPRQAEYILEVAPDLANKVFAYTKVAHYRLLPSDHHTRMFEPNDTIFWPFRISDKSYQFTEFLKMYHDSGLWKTNKLIISDPNNSFSWAGIPFELTKSIEVISPSKDEYYKILGSSPNVVMLDDIDTVLHPGTIECFNYGCNVITYRNKLIQHDSMVDHIDEIPQMIAARRYNSRINTRDFIYSYKEKSEIYSQSFVQGFIDTPSQ